jgi:chromate transport protein ChrA
MPGLLLAVGVQGLWRLWRTKPVVAAMLRGINATAIGLVFTAVYRLWQIGYLTPLDAQGQSLAEYPWWVVVAVVTYAESCWWKVPPAPAILFGAVLGLGWYGVTGGAWPQP